MCVLVKEWHSIVPYDTFMYNGIDKYHKICETDLIKVNEFYSMTRVLLFFVAVIGSLQIDPQNITLLTRHSKNYAILHILLQKV